MGKKEMPPLKHSADRSAIIWGRPSGFPGIRTGGQGASGGCSRAGAPSLPGVTGARRAASLQDFPQLKRSSAEEGRPASSGPAAQGRREAQRTVTFPRLKMCVSVAATVLTYPYSG